MEGYNFREFPNFYFLICIKIQFLITSSLKEKAFSFYILRFSQRLPMYTKMA